MQTLKTGDSFEENGYTITRIGAGAQESESDWALFCIAHGGCKTCDGGAGVCPAKENGGECTCDKNHVHTWVKKGHSFSAGNKGCKLVDSNRDESTLEQTDGQEAGMCDC